MVKKKKSACQCRRCKRCGFNPWVRKIPWRKKWQPTPVILLGESHWQRHLVGYSPWDHRELDTIEDSVSNMIIKCFVNFLCIGIVHKILSFKPHSSDLGSQVQIQGVKIRSGLPEIRMGAGNPTLPCKHQPLFSAA